MWARLSGGPLHLKEDETKPQLPNGRSFTDIVEGRDNYKIVSGLKGAQFRYNKFSESSSGEEGFQDQGPLLIEDDAIRRNRVDRGRILMLYPFLKASPKRINLVFKGETFDIILEEDKQPINSSWFKEFLSLRSKLVNSNLNSSSNWEGFFQNLGKDVSDYFFDCEAPKRGFSPVYSSRQVMGIRSVDKGKGAWTKKAKVRKVITYNKTTKVNLGKRNGDVVRRESKSFYSTSSNIKGFLWKGECSRRRLSVGPQSPFLDLILNAHPRLSSNGLDISGGKTHGEDVCRPGGTETVPNAFVTKAHRPVRTKAHSPTSISPSSVEGSSEKV
ncbi:hypothetical protein QYF36_019064 [Acer negundo]|nr:hypothetical protein QYF36_019064 [Acer negundo]